MENPGKTSFSTGLLLGLILCAGIDGAAEPSASLPKLNVVDFGEKSTGNPDKSQMNRREFTILSGEKSLYVLYFTRTEQPNKTTLLTMGIDYKAGGQGWYSGDTFRFHVNGTDLHQQDGKWENVRILEQGGSLLVEATLVQAAASVRLRLALAPERDGMDVEAMLLRPAAKEFAVMTSCFPAYFTSWNKRRGDRWAVTAARSVEEPREPGLDLNARTWKSVTQHADLDPAKENWVFYYDRVFNDRARGNGQGVCGLVYRVEDLRSVGLDVTDYQISTFLKAKPEGSVIRFTLWQSPAYDFGPELEKFPAAAEKARQRLSDPLRFVPESIRGFDETAERASLEQLRKTLQPNAPDVLEKAAASLETASAAVNRLRKAAAGQLFSEEQNAETTLREYRLCAALAKRKAPHPLRFLVLAGRDFPEWKIREAAAAMTPPAIPDFSYFSMTYQGDLLSRFPVTEMEMSDYDGVVAINVPAGALKESAQRMLREFVRNGGGLIVCGGFHAYGGGGYRGTVLDELLPVNDKGPFDVKRLPSAAQVRQGETTAGLPAWPGGKNRVVMWMHEVTVKPGAQVALEAGGWFGGRRPFLVVGEYGQGRVAALVGTVNGEPPSGKNEFWNDPQWPAYLAGLLRWGAGKNP